MSWALVLAWIVVVVSVAWSRRPGAPIARGLGVRSRPTTRSSRCGPAERLGRFVRSRLGRPPDPARDRQLGWVLPAGVALGLVKPFLAPGAAGIWLALRWRARERARGRNRQLFEQGPEVVDLLLLAVEAGCTPRLALEATGAWSRGPWGAALATLLERVDHGQRLGDALPALEIGLGEVARPLVVALQDAEHYGVPLLPALERLAREMRVEQQRRAEERARRVPVRLLFPLVFCTLPAFVLLTVVPLLAGTLPTLST